MTTHERQPIAKRKIVDFIGNPVIQDEPQCISYDVAPAVVGHPREICADGVTDEENSKMQVCWNRAMCEQMNIPEGYQNVAVLIIKWAEELDQLKSEKEVRELDQLFRQRFYYPTQVEELHNKSNAQLQLNLAVMNFVHKYDGPHNLLIVYYTGHGSFHETGSLLELHASNNPADLSRYDHDARAFWNQAERPLIENADSDMVAIFDTCFASNLCKNSQPEDPRNYEFLTASGHDRTTAGPGPRSFTTALISSLRDLLRECGDRPFTIRQLCEKINLHPKRRNNQSHVWSPFKRYDRNIALAPLKRTLAERKEEFSLGQTRALLTLRLPLTVERLNEQQISRTARALSAAIKRAEVPARRIDWVRLRSSGRTTTFANLGTAFVSAVRWKNRRLSSRQSQPPIISPQDHQAVLQTTGSDSHAQTELNDPDTTIDSPALVESPTVCKPMLTPPPHVSRKRKHSGEHGSDGASGSESKRKSPAEKSEQQCQKPCSCPHSLTPVSEPDPDTDR